MATIHRRTFLQLSAGTGLALAAARVSARSINEQLNVGFIGTGGRAQELLKSFGALPDVRIAALCDPDQKHLETTAAKHPDAARYADLRALLEDKNIDAVVIATCNHWHALAAIWACEAGKDVYVEKPLAHNHWEGQQVVRAARTHNRIVQVGTQQRSDPLQAELKEFLHGEKALGPIQHVVVCRIGERKPIGKRATPLQPPSTLDYSLWLGPALEQPIYRDNLHYDWHWDWNTGNGELGNWGVHVLDDALNVVLLDKAPFPKRVVSAGGRVAWDDAGQTPNVCFAYYDTGSIPIMFAMSNLSSGRDKASKLQFKGVSTGYVIQCESGYYEGGRGGGTAHFKDGKTKRFRGDLGAGHARNFVDAIAARNRGELNCEVETGHHSTAWCNLADAALRSGGSYAPAEAAAVGRPPQTWQHVVELLEQHLAKNSVEPSAGLHLSPVLTFDATSEKFTGENSDRANSFLRREYRKGFEVPEIV